MSALEVQERLTLAELGAPFLVYRDPAGRQRLVGLTDAGVVTIGRQPASSVSLTWDPAVSRVHAALERVGDEWTLVDDGGSRNGSFLNGARCFGRRRLKSGDIIRVGATTLLYVVPQSRQGSQSTAALLRSNAPAFTEAQRRVLTALCRPLVRERFGTPAGNREIAAELFLSVETVKTHLHALVEAFGVQELPHGAKRGELARRALELGAVTEDELLAGARGP